MRLFKLFYLVVEFGPFRNKSANNSAISVSSTNYPLCKLRSAGSHRYTCTGCSQRPGEATIIGVSLLILAVVLGKPIAGSSFAHYFIFSRTGRACC